MPAFFIEPRTASYEIRDGLVHCTFKSGRESYTLCATIHSVRHSVEMARRVLDEHDRRQRGAVCKMRKRRK